MKFSSMEEFRQAVRAYGIKERRALKFITNDRRMDVRRGIPFICGIVGYMILRRCKSRPINLSTFAPNLTTTN